VSKTTLEVQIVRLRKKLEQAGASAPNIKSIRGMGYQLCVPIVVNKDFLSPHHA
jgi:DNA-binding response OmpR family regulator